MKDQESWLNILSDDLLLIDVGPCWMSSRDKGSQRKHWACSAITKQRSLQYQLIQCRLIPSFETGLFSNRFKIVNTLTSE